MNVEHNFCRGEEVPGGGPLQVSAYPGQSLADLNSYRNGPESPRHSCRRVSTHPLDSQVETEYSLFNRLNNFLAPMQKVL